MTDGQEALQIVVGDPERIHLLVSDLAMPGMNGRDLAQPVRIRRPEVLVLFVSGDGGETEAPTTPPATAFR